MRDGQPANGVVITPDISTLNSAVVTKDHPCVEIFDSLCNTNRLKEDITIRENIRKTIPINGVDIKEYQRKNTQNKVRKTPVRKRKEQNKSSENSQRITTFFSRQPPPPKN